jgi:hypothetical protein
MLCTISKYLQHEILLVIKEITDLREINSDHEFDKELKAARARLVALQRKRDDMDGVSRTIELE